MERTQLKNKEGQVLTTKEGQPLVDNKLQAGDQFIPVINSVLETKHEAEVQGKKKVITEYKIPAKVKEADGTVIEGDAENGAVFIKLTPTQAKKLNQLAKDGVELNQKIFTAYSYDHAEYGECIGVTEKVRKPPIDFED